MADDFIPIRNKLTWAKAQLPVIGAQAQLFIESKPYTVCTEVDQQRGGHFRKIRYTEPVPDPILICISNVVHQIRTSLDHLAVALAIRNGAAYTKDVYFPISGNRQEFFEGKKAGIKKNASPPPTKKSLKISSLTVEGTTHCMPFIK